MEVRFACFHYVIALHAIDVLNEMNLLRLGTSALSSLCYSAFLKYDRSNARTVKWFLNAITTRKRSS
jgi:hypothetical protein